MTNYVQEGKSVTVPAPSGGVVSGDLVVIGSLIGVAAATAAQTVDVALAVEGVFTLPAASADEIAVGDLLYYDSTGPEVTKVEGTSSRPIVGVAVSAKAAAATSVNCKLGVHGLTGAAGS
jgi:predicted RecA/RadA family phage recombinase